MVSLVSGISVVMVEVVVLDVVREESIAGLLRGGDVELVIVGVTGAVEVFLDVVDVIGIEDGEDGSLE